jgi:hypothetical protein
MKSNNRIEGKKKLFADDMILAQKIENPTNLPKMRTKSSGYIVNIQKSIVFLSTSNEHTETKM